MEYTEELKKTVQYEGNGRIIFLNPENYHWVRMNKESYVSICEGEEQKNRLYQIFSQKYDLFGESQDDVNIRSVYFSVTGKCNLQCAFCTMNSGPDVSTDKDITINEIRHMLIPKLKEIAPRKIVITGGEPLVREDIALILESFAQAFGRERVLLQTNGLILTKEFVKLIAPFISTIEISIENIFANKTILGKMEQIFQCARDVGMELSLSFVLDDESRRYLWEAIELCHKYNGAFTLRVVSMVGRATKDNYQTNFTHSIDTLKVYYDFFSYLLEKEYLEDNFISGYLDNLQPKKACGAYGKILSIHPDGTTYMCGNFKKSKYSMGNIRNRTMDEICADLQEKLKSEYVKNRLWVTKNETCKNCPEIYFCPGPCGAEVEESEEIANYQNSKCISNKTLLRYNMYYFDKKKTVKENIELLVKYLKDILEGAVQLA